MQPNSYPPKNIHNYYDMERPFSIKRILLPLSILAIILLGGGTRSWSAGMILVGIGLMICIQPPIKSAGKWLDISFIILALLGLLQFFPQADLNRPEWWITAKNTLSIPLGNAVSSQPLLSLEKYFLFLAGFCWFYICLDQRMHHQKRMHWLWTISTGMTVLSLAIIVGNIYQIKYPLGDAATVFSYFPNRNQTANILCLSAIISFCLFIECFKTQQHKQAVVATLNTLVIFFALIFMLSRSSMILFFAGIILWLLISHHQTSKIITAKYIIPCVILLLSLFIMASGDNLHRFEELFDPSSPGAFRSLILRDTLELVKDQPLLGVGMGNYQYVINHYREASTIFGKLIHPESDWLWSLSELGFIFTAVLGLSVIYALIQITKPNFKYHISYRAISTVCVIIFLLHTLCDVPGHRFGTVFLALMLYALSISHSQETFVTIFPPRVFQILGSILIFVGSLWITASILDKPWHSEITTAISKNKVIQNTSTNDFQSIMENIENGKQWTPLDAWWYFQEAQAQLRLNHTPIIAKKNFEKARFLDPLNIHYPLYEGVLWLSYSPEMAFGAFQSALSYPNIKPESTWVFILNHADNPRFSDYLYRLTATHKDFYNYYLKRLPNDTLGQIITKKISRDKSLDSINQDNFSTILLKWAQSSSAHHLLDYLSKNTISVDNAWIYQAIAYGHLQFYPQALSITKKNISQPQWPDLQEKSHLKTEELATRFTINPQDIIYGLLLLKIYIAEKDYEKALSVIKKLKKGPNPTPIIYYWESSILEKNNDLSGSWEAMRQYLLHSSISPLIQHS